MTSNICSVLSYLFLRGNKVGFTTLDYMFHTGDWHCAYVLLYGPRVLEIDESAESGTAAEQPTTDDVMS